MFGPFFVTLSAEVTENGRNSVTPPLETEKGGGNRARFFFKGPFAIWRQIPTGNS